MCTTVFYKDEEIETPKELMGALKIPIEKLTIDISNGFKDLNINACLCQVDVKKTLTDAGLNFTISEDNFEYEII